MNEKRHNSKPLKKAPKIALIDRQEHTSLMEPLLLQSDKYGDELDDLVLTLVSESASFKSSMPTVFATSLCQLVRSMNCYYSNLIEGHDTHPIDIERALKGNYSKNPEQRNLQLEAQAHIAVQTWIDEGKMSGSPMALSNLQEIHRRFYELLPDELNLITDPQTRKIIRIIPGQLRQQDVAVGNHLAISPGAVPRFIQRYEETYSTLGKSARILAAAAAHHRFLWIHPFWDGNGRVARLMSYASMLETLNTGGLWSIARGLARQQQEYKSHLSQCDQARRGTHDGRGALSEKALFEFSKFFLTTCIDQVKFMKSLVRPDLLRKRVITWANDEITHRRLPPRTNIILESLLSTGSVQRSDIPEILDLSPAGARRVIAALAEQEIVVSDSSRAPVRLAFPATMAAHWLPGLFPEKC